MEAKFSDLSQKSYAVPARLGLLTKLCVASSLVCGLAAHVGDGIAKKDVCFYPEASQKQDNTLRATRRIPYKNAPTFNARGKLKSEPKLLLGKKYCTPEHIATIPNSYFTANKTKSSNPNYNAWAFLSADGLSSKGLFVLRELAADNPFKIHLGLAAVLFGMVGLASVSREQDVLTGLRPHYRATQQFESIRANYSVQMGEKLLELSGIELLRILRGIKVAEARQQFIATVTPQQQTALLMAMSAEDYHEYGYLLDRGASFDKFEEPQQQPHPQLPHGNPGTYDRINDPSDKLPQQQNDKFCQWRQQGIEILKGMGISDRSIALVAPSRCGKTTVVFFLLDQWFKRFPEMKCWIWQGKGVEPIHPSIKKSYHRGFSLQSMGLEALDKVWEIYEQRQLELQRGIKEFIPCKLVITDWQSIKDLMEVSEPKLFKEVAAKVMTIVNNGAALGVTAIIDTQSPNIDDWGLGSASIRDNFDIYALARMAIIDGQPKGDLKALPKVVKNVSLIPDDKERNNMLSQFELLKLGFKLGEISTSVLLSTVGICRLGITPNFERKTLTFKTNDSSNSSDSKLAETAEPYVDIHSAPTIIQDQELADKLNSDDANNKPSFDELLDAIVKSFQGKGAVKIKRIPSGCNRVRTELSKFHKENHEAILVLLVEGLIKLGKAETPDDMILTQKVKDGYANLTPDSDFIIV